MNGAVRGAALGLLQQTCGALQTSWCRTLFVSVQRYQNTAGDAKTAERIPEHSLVPPVPGESSPLRWGGIKFEELPIVHIKATYNNTHIQVTSFDNKPLVRASCGTEGYKNAKKSSTVAAQTTGIAAATKSVNKGVSFVRVVVKGMGPGRVHAIKGLTMGGLEVISLTDNTPIPHNGCRPRKARRL
ncbi:PREDICTED: 28S ribosomal protein S11, mitochondrial [Nanorana parkeri]|uniref:28S ribosomal protein S11, mitochondrial n=1 Tax=Nanorana parkeri TaxID=125878 RepID=UPI0008546DC1|nr:PREDICTED: 28S ribosomal protein S11, mitochondrial [Nanorana parkeri]